MSHNPKYILRWYDAKEMTYKTDPCDTHDRAVMGAKALAVISGIPVDSIGIYKLESTVDFTVKGPH